MNCDPYLRLALLKGIVGQSRNYIHRMPDKAFTIQEKGSRDTALHLLLQENELTAREFIKRTPDFVFGLKNYYGKSPLNLALSENMATLKLILDKTSPDVIGTLDLPPPLIKDYKDLSVLIDWGKKMESAKNYQ